jgi:prepilin-type N-terminal cleavage/methylation domain-containing protein
MSAWDEMKDLGRKDGFTLVEIALALLVVAIGVVSIMGLFPAGLRANQKGIDETRIAMFAEDVLSGVKTVIEETLWDQVENELTSTGLPSVAPDLFANNTFHANGTRAIHKYSYGAPGSTLDAGTVRYELDISRVELSPGVFSPNRYGITLQVWPNEFGQNDDDGFVFYTEAFYHGRH